MSYSKQRLVSQREFDSPSDDTCPDMGPYPAFCLILRCIGGGKYPAEALNQMCPCGKPSAAIVRGPKP